MDYGAATLDRIVSSVWRTDDFGRLLGKLERYLPSDDLPSGERRLYVIAVRS